jgi:hypothetical protein
MLEVNQVASATFRKTGKLDVFLAGTFAPWSSRHTLVTRAPPGGHGNPAKPGKNGITSTGAQQPSVFEELQHRE